MLRSTFVILGMLCLSILVSSCAQGAEFEIDSKTILNIQVPKNIEEDINVQCNFYRVTNKNYKINACTYQIGEGALLIGENVQQLSGSLLNVQVYTLKKSDFDNDYFNQLVIAEDFTYGNNTHLLSSSDENDTERAKKKLEPYLYNVNVIMFNLVLNELNCENEITIDKLIIDDFEFEFDTFIITPVDLPKTKNIYNNITLYTLGSYQEGPFFKELTYYETMFSVLKPISKVTIIPLDKNQTTINKANSKEYTEKYDFLDYYYEEQITTNFSKGDEVGLYSEFVYNGINNVEYRKYDSTTVCVYVSIEYQDGTTDGFCDFTIINRMPEYTLLHLYHDLCS